MDLTLPMRSLIPSLDADALEVLSRTESAMSATQAARRAGRGSRSGLTLVLDRLAKAGLVIVEPSNTGRLYRLNRNHVLAPAVLAAAEARREVLSRLRTGAQALSPTPLHVSVFGSFARGEGGEDSDLDLLIVTRADVDRHAEPWRTQVRALEDDVRAWTGNRLEPLVFSVDDLAAAASAGERIVSELAKDAVTILGENFEDLLTGTRATAP